MHIAGAFLIFCQLLLQLQFQYKTSSKELGLSSYVQKSRLFCAFAPLRLCFKEALQKSLTY